MEHKHRAVRCERGRLARLAVLVAAVAASPAFAQKTPTLCDLFPAAEAARLIGSPVTPADGAPSATWCEWHNRTTGLVVSAVTPGAGLDKERFLRQVREHGRGEERDEGRSVGVPAHSLAGTAGAQTTMWMLAGSRLYLLQVRGAGTASPAMPDKLRAAARRLARQLPR